MDLQKHGVEMKKSGSFEARQTLDMKSESEDSSNNDVKLSWRSWVVVFVTCFACVFFFDWYTCLTFRTALWHRFLLSLLQDLLLLLLFET